MVSTFQLVARPPATADHTSHSRYRDAGIVVALAGLMVVAAATIASLVVSDDPAGARGDTLAWATGVNFAGFNVIMIAIAITLMGIIVRLWMRVDSVKEALPQLKADASGTEDPVPSRKVATPFGDVEVTTDPPKPLWIHRLAEAAWTPMLVMAPMVVAAGIGLSIAQASETAGTNTFDDLAALASGTLVLGLALMLGAISFILGTILSSLRKGGAEVQASVGAHIKTLKVPTAVWAFLALMMAGVMAAMANFGLLVAVTAIDEPASWLAWLQPLGLFSLGLLLAGIVLALYTIGNVVGFQFNRIRELIATGR